MTPLVEVFILLPAFLAALACWPRAILLLGGAAILYIHLHGG